MQLPSRADILPIVLSFSVLVAACTESPPTGAAESGVSQGDGDVASAVAEIGRAIAIALAEDPTARLDLATAFSESPYAEGKLLLHEYLLTPSGRQLRDHLEPIFSETGLGFHNVIQDTGPLDIYLPAFDEFQTWDGNVSPTVFATFDPDALPFPGFSPDGDLLYYDGD